MYRKHIGRLKLTLSMATFTDKSSPKYRYDLLRQNKCFWVGPTISTMVILTPKNGNIVKKRN